MWVWVRVEIYSGKHREFTVAGVAGVGECVTVMPLPEHLPSFSGTIAPACTCGGWGGCVG